ncbi:hypothetical protein Tco_0670914 [Tanacetum coccineum]
MFLNMDQLEKQLDKEEFQEIRSMAAFKVPETQFQMFIKSQIYLDDEYVIMTRNYFLQYTQLEIREFRDTLIQHMKYTTEEKVDTSKALDASLVDTKNSGTELVEQDTSSRSGNDAHVDDADMKPIYDEELMTEVHLITDHNVSAIGQQHTEQPEFNNEGEVDQNVEQCHDTCPLPAKLTNNQTTELSNQSLESKNIFGLRWVPTGKIFTSSTTKVDSEPTNGSNEDITNQYECKQTLDVSAGTLNLSAGTSMASEPISSKGSSNTETKKDMDKGTKEKKPVHTNLSEWSIHNAIGFTDENSNIEE